jgi:hypothetical protein
MHGETVIFFLCLSLFPVQMCVMVGLLSEKRLHRYSARRELLHTVHPNTDRKSKPRPKDPRKSNVIVMIITILYRSKQRGKSIFIKSLQYFS